MNLLGLFPFQQRRLVALAAAVGLAAAAIAQTPVTLNFVDADIEVVAKAVGELTGKTFILDPKVKGKINIQSARGVAPGLAYPTFLSALRMAGFAAVEGAGGIVRVVPEIDAKTLPTPLGANGSSGGSGAITTKVIPLKHQSAGQVINAVRPLVAAANALTVYPPGNAIIITDYGDNIRRIEAVIARLDTPSASAPELITLVNAHALDVAATLNRAFSDGASQGAEARDRLVITADPRSNSVIVRSEDAGRLARVKALIQDLDRPTTAPGNIRIVYLKHADAAQVAMTLRRVLGAEGGSASSGGSNNTPSANSLSSLLPSGGTQNAGSNSSPLAAATAALTGAASATQSGSLPQPSSNNSVAFSAGGATVYADSTINALVISAPTGVYNNLRSVIEQLDVRRAQVYVEALIAEVQADRAAEFGIQWQALDALGNGGTQGIGGTNFTSSAGSNILGVAANPTGVNRGLNLGLVRGALTYGGKTILNLGLLARAMQNDTSANILSMPTLLALDNEEARFSGGQNVPFLTGQYATTGGNTTNAPFQTIERRDVGLTLRVKPLITEGGAIRLQLYQEVSSVVESAAVAQGLASLNKRVLETSVLADDGQIIVLGGLLQEGFTNDQDKVPVLGDTPFIGNLFRYDTRKRTKTNLMIFLRPTVLRNASQAGALSNERYRTLGMDQESVSPEARFALPAMTNPGLPLSTPAIPASAIPAPTNASQPVAPARQ
jgi:general secretion pathway protein D